MTANGSDVPIKSALGRLLAPWIVMSKEAGYSAVAAMYILDELLSLEMYVRLSMDLYCVCM